jgi:hypothetical protein
MNAVRASSLFWLFVAVVVSVASFRLELGTLRTPGMGFVPFGAAVLLGLLSVVSFFQPAVKEKAAEKQPLFRGTHWSKAVFAFAALLVYAQVIPWVGYNISTFVLMTFLFWIVEHRNIWKVIIFALLTTIITYYVFSKWLNCQFPVGPLGF